MASSEGVGAKLLVDWSTFNRWCDEYADRHSGMKPKVEDVRKWHRENAEKVWPDSSERPSVFLAVSHNKGRRVRGHKTCEYYKRYRAGKAAEQQLAARLQPAALSGRRILAVTAAARKVNTDCTRSGAKRPSPDILAAPDLEDGDMDGDELGAMAHTEKRRRRMRFGGATDSSRPGGAGARGSSSDGLSDDASWASGAGTSNEDGDDDEEEEDGDSGSGVMAAATAREAPSAARRCTAHPYHQPHAAALRAHSHGGPHTGVHITVVRRDADGRTIQVETQPARGGGSHQEHGARQGLHSHFVGGHTAVVPSSGGGLKAPYGPANGHEGGCRAQGRRGRDPGYESGSGAESEGAATLLDQVEPRRRQQQMQQLCSYNSWPDGGHLPEQAQQQRQLSGGGAAATSNGWVWGGDHPGVAPRACRRGRSCTEAEQRRPPRFSGYVATPLGLMPVFNVGGGGAAAAVGGGGRRGRAGVRRTQLAARWEPDGAGAGGGGGGGGGAVLASLAIRDPLDLLAEAACDALDSPRPVGPNDGVPGATDEPGQVAAAAAAAAADGLEAVPGGDAAAGGAAGCPALRRPACSSDSCRDLQQHPKPEVSEHALVRAGFEGEAASADVATSFDPTLAALRDRGQGRQQQQQQVREEVLQQQLLPKEGELAEALVAGAAVVKREPCTDGTVCAGGQSATGGGCGAADAAAPGAKAAPAPECNGGRAAAAAWPGCGPGSGIATKLEQQPPQQQIVSLAMSGAAVHSAAPVLAPIPLFQAAQRSPPRLAAAVAMEHAAGADGATAEPACGAGSGGGSADAALMPTTAVPPAAAAAAAVGDLSGCRLPVLTPAELEASLLAALGQQQQQQSRLPLNAAAVGGGLGLGLGPVGAVPPPPPLLPLPLPALPPPLPQVPPAPPLLWPVLAGGMGPMLAGPPVLTAAAAAAPLFADASALGGALAGAGTGGGGGGQLLPMMRLLQMQMATRGLDPNACRD
ncbi:hypothetical protein PLESTB_000189300 [Pleodorina starrii]|uniref:Uncharacterized protein n=1 Tax=Pleodorina starrii TaxID=330485 RepID=A0A9W6BBM3_9CHLO|nr:hypothetical protein PLESTB_000189300 [Pleodorina starrii]GLC73579.1 hypothetical protein PLESTF_001393400 [Pleodorina starrii]